MVPDSLTEPHPSPWEDLPEGVALLMACKSERAAGDALQLAVERAAWAERYADHVAAVALTLGTLSYADVGRLLGITRQGARKRFGAVVDAQQAELDAAAPVLHPATPRSRPAEVPADGFTWPEVQS